MGLDREDPIMTIRIRRGVLHPFVRTQWFAASVCVCACVLLSSCKLPDLVNNAETPSYIRDPKVVQNAAGAVAMYRGAIDAFACYVDGGGEEGLCNGGEFYNIPNSYVAISGVFTDELTGSTSSTGNYGLLDLRALDRTLAGGAPEFGYKGLHLIRGRSRVARAYLRQYGSNLPQEWLAHLYAMEGFAAVMLAELQCSGIPLGTLGDEGAFTTTRGFTTDEVYAYALAHFDSALATAGDSVRFRYVAQLGKARALLGIGDVQGAAEVVAGVPDTYRYVITYAVQSPKFIPVLPSNSVIQSDREGINGLPFISSGDPRTALPAIMDRTAPLVFSTGLEVRLLQAEAAVLGDDPKWLVALNALRTTCVLGDPCPSPAPAGLGGISNLPPLVDPATGMSTHKDSVDARIDLVFAERAFWLYLTGRRQGDLRRLVRHYGRLESSVYPIGFWSSTGSDIYGSAVVVPVPDVERKFNLLYKGCHNLDA